MFIYTFEKKHIKDELRKKKHFLKSVWGDYDEEAPQKL